MQLTLDTYTLKQQRADELLDAALAWIADNPTAWDDFVGMCQRDALDIGRVRIKRNIEDLRYRPANPATDVVKIPNAFSAAFSRILIAWHPELEPAVPVATSKLDGCSIPPRQR